MSLHYLVKLEMLIAPTLLLTCYKKELQNFSTSTVASKFARFEFRWLQCVGTIAREGVQDTHHWSGWTETATKNGVGQAGSCRHCGSHSSVASSIAPNQWCLFRTSYLAIFPTRCYQLDLNLVKIFTSFYSKFIQETACQFSSKSPELCGRYYKKYFGLFFSGRSVLCSCSLRYMFLVGEHCDHETLHWVRDRFQVPCLDHWWQTGMDCMPSCR